MPCRFFHDLSRKNWKLLTPQDKGLLPEHPPMNMCHSIALSDKSCLHPGFPDNAFER